jgi:hypothetical protein
VNIPTKNWPCLANCVKAITIQFSLSVAVFAYGFSVSQFKIFPYKILRDARTAWRAMIPGQATAEPNGLAKYRVEVSQPTVVAHSQSFPGGLLLMCSGHNSLGSQAEEGTVAWIMDRAGKVVHRWKSPIGIWEELQQVTRIPGVSGPINPVGLHMFDNGDLLATYHGFNTFPFAIGLAKFDRNSRLLWKKELLTHHSFSVAANGHIFVPAMEVVNSPVAIGDTFARIESASGKIYNDLVLELDADGNEIQRISIKDALFKSGWRGHLVRSNSAVVVDEDPFHLNDVQWLGPQAALLPGTSADDLLVSMRNINTLGILDPRKQQFKWVSSGAVIGQHSPRIVKDGILVMDNLGGDQRLGGTQVVRIDFQTGLPSTIFPLDLNQLPDLCRTANSGHLEVHPSGRYVLLSLTHSGFVWEIDLQTGQVVWEYIHIQPDTQGQPQRVIGSARYINNPTFLTHKQQE